MRKKGPYDIIISRYITEKASVLGELQNNSSNACVKRCVTPKYVFLVHPKANKQEIAEAIEEIYAGKNFKVTGVNTINTKPKSRRMRGRSGMKAGFKKAIVSLSEGDLIEEKV
jgi:large subunit ribosomal protein L23